MEIFDVTQTDPSLLVSDSMGIHYSMDDQVEKLVKMSSFLTPTTGATQRLHISPAPLFGPESDSRLEVSEELRPEPRVALATRVGTS